ncbi:HNH endonuclease [Gryllotalpicola reticulitermitis]|uniref:HNH endonuclease n=1 Tax=Gryllotalpicola reticulitermitis TaxID=1184153 RepID=A0ABV8Q3H8_9MICO
MCAWTAPCTPSRGTHTAATASRTSPVRARQICLLPVERDALPFEDKSPVLDHITRARDGGGDEPENLRLAHRWCNGARENGGLERFDFEVFDLARQKFEVSE